MWPFQFPNYISSLNNQRNLFTRPSRGPSLKFSFCLFVCLFLSRCRKSALLRRWLVCALFADHVRTTCEVCLFQCELMVKYEIMVVACQIGPFHLKLTQIKSEMNCITKHKIMYWEPEAGHETQRWELERHITRVKSNNIYIFAIFVFTFIFYVTQDRRQKIRWNKVLFCRVFDNATDRWFTPRLDKVQ